MTNQQRRRKQRRKALLACPTKQVRRPRFDDRTKWKDSGLPPPTRRMVRLGIDRASMAQGGRP